jgi:hypothetical protein
VQLVDDEDDPSVALRHLAEHRLQPVAHRLEDAVDAVTGDAAAETRFKPR